MIRRRTQLFFGLTLFIGCAGHQAVHHVTDHLGTLTAKWQRLSDLQQHFVLGYTQAEQGRFAEALAHLQQIRGHYPVLADYLEYTMARAAIGAGKLELAREAALAARQASPGALAEKIDALRIAIAMRARQWDEAEALIQDDIQMATSAEALRASLVQRAELDLAKGALDAAGSRYLELYRIAQYPDQILAAKEGMRAVERAGGTSPLRTASGHARYQMARDFLTRGLAAEAARVLADVDGVARQELADAYFRARLYDRAADLYGQMIAQGATDVALLERAATALARAGRDEAAIAMQEVIIAGNPPAQHLQRARFKRAFLLLEHGEYARAVAAYREWLATARQGAPRAEVFDALWAIVWAEYRQHHADAALAALAELEGAVGADRLWRARIAYWTGRVYDSARRVKEARAQFTRVVQEYSGSYYGRLALARLQRRQDTTPLFEFSVSAAKKPHRTAIPLDTHLPKAVELARLGLWEDAVAEEEHHAGANPPLLPIHDDVIAHFAALWGLDAELVRRLMWQESGNRPQVVSPAGAIGLLQLMPSTAAAMARALQLLDFRTADLFRPLPNLRLGMWYLRTLKERYQGKIPLMLASYNAGEHNVDRWWAKRRDHDMEEFIETIPLDETRNYVRRVLQMYW